MQQPWFIFSNTTDVVSIFFSYVWLSFCTLPSSQIRQRRQKEGKTNQETVNIMYLPVSKIMYVFSCLLQTMVLVGHKRRSLCNTASKCNYQCLLHLSLHCFSIIICLSYVIQSGRIRAAGIVGIERKLEERRKEMDKNISEASNFFQNQYDCTHFQFTILRHQIAFMFWNGTFSNTKCFVKVGKPRAITIWSRQKERK